MFKFKLQQVAGIFFSNQLGYWIDVSDDVMSSEEQCEHCLVNLCNANMRRTITVNVTKIKSNSPNKTVHKFVMQSSSFKCELISLCFEERSVWTVFNPFQRHLPQIIPSN